MSFNSKPRGARDESVRLVAVLWLVSCTLSCEADKPVDTDSDSGPTVVDAGDPVDPQRDAAADLDADTASDAHANEGLPEAHAYSVEVDEDSVLEGQLTGSDPDGDALQFELVESAAHGVLTLDPATGFARYVPDADYFGTERARFRVSDGSSFSSAATLTIHVLPVNDAPLASSANLETEEDTALALTLSSSDVDGDVLKLEIVDRPLHGTLSGFGSERLYVPDADFNGDDSFTYRTQDGSADSAVATISIHVVAVDDAPNAVDDLLALPEGTTATRLTRIQTSVLDNDQDVEGSVLTATLAPNGAPSHGSLMLNEDGTFEYTHDGGESLEDSFSYLACDAQDPPECDTATVHIQVVAVNDAPDATSDALSVMEAGTATELTGGATSVLANDPDADSTALTVSLVSGPAHGHLTLATDGTFSYSHDGTETVADQFVYRVCDDALLELCRTATVAITIVPVNEAPQPMNDAIVMLEEGGTATTLVGGIDSVLFNDSDPDGDALSAVVQDLPMHGTVMLNTDGTFEYTHDGGESVADSFTYLACDEALPSPLCVLGSVSIVITHVNDAALAAADAYSVPEGGTLTSSPLSVLDNDGDAESEALTVNINPITPPAHGSLTLNADGTFVYIHAGGENASDSFSYQVCDPTPACDAATVTLTIEPINDAPVGVADTIAVAEGGTVTQLSNADSSVLDNDLDPDALPNTLTANVIDEPLNGMLTLLPDGTFEYVHDGGQTTLDSFTYEACDVELACSDPVQVDIVIGGTNDRPVAVDDAATVTEGGSVALLVGSVASVLTNDTDADADTLAATVMAGPLHGSVVLQLDGTFVYTHDGGESVTDSFTYRACDDDSLLPLCDEGTVQISVTGVNDAPVPMADAIAVMEGGTATLLVGGANTVLMNDSDAEPGVLTVTLATGGGVLHGTLMLNAAGTFSYVHDGGQNIADAFTYRVCDAGSPQQCANQLVTITITPVNDAPVTVADAISVAEGGTATTLVSNALSVLTNDGDPDSDTLTAALLVGTAPIHGTLLLNLNGTFSYVHDGGESAADSFSYRACDPSLSCTTGVVSITITRVNDPPFAAPDAISVAEGGVATSLVGGATRLLTNDTDAESQSLVLTVTPVIAPLHGMLVLDPSGTFSYTHDGGESTSDMFSYQVCETGALPACGTGVVSISITPVNDPPVGVADAITLIEGGTATTLVSTASSVLFNDTDAEPGVLTAMLGTGPTHATSFTLNTDGTFSYVHMGAGFAADSFTYRACDSAVPQLCSAVTTVSITVAPLNRLPVAMDDSILVAEGGTSAVLVSSATSVRTNDNDADGDPLTVTRLISPLYASAFTLNADGTFSYTHNGGETTSDSFTYSVCETARPTLCDEGAVSISITPVNDPSVIGTYAYPMVMGNTLFTVARTGPSDSAVWLGKNDSDAEGALTITAFSAASAQGGIVAANMATGEFTYLPPVGYVGPDTFTYSTTDASVPPQTTVVTVTLTVGNLVWYVDGSVGATGTGRSSGPFRTLAEADVASPPGLAIFVRTGSYSGSLALAPGQGLVGQAGASLTLPVAAAAFAAGAPPTITGTTGAVVTLTSGNGVLGVNLVSTAGDAIRGTGVTGILNVLNSTLTATAGIGIGIAGNADVFLSNLGTIVARTGLSLQNSGITTTIGGTGVAVAATGGPALDITGGTLAARFDSLSSLNSASFGVRLDGVTGELTSLATTVTDPVTDGIVIRNSVMDAKWALGPCSVTLAGTESGATGDGYSFSDNPTAAITLSMAVDPVTANGRGLFASNSGRLDIVPAPLAISATGGAAIDLRDTTRAAPLDIWQFPMLNSDASVAEGIRLEALDRQVQISGGELTQSGGHGVYGKDIAGLVLTGLTIDGAGDGPGENAVMLENVSSTVYLESLNIVGMAYHGIQILNDKESANVTLLNVDVADNNGLHCLDMGVGVPCMGSGLVIDSNGVLNLTVENLWIDNVTGDGMALTAIDTDADINATISSSLFENSPEAETAIRFKALGGSLIYTLQTSTFSDWRSHVISTTFSGDGTQVSGRIIGNTIVANNLFGTQGIRILGDAVASTDTYTGVFLVDDNDIELTDGVAVWVENRDAGSNAAALHATITNNNSIDQGTDGYRIRSRAGTYVCARVQGNTSTTPTDPFYGGYTVLASNTSRLQLYDPMMLAATAAQYFPAYTNVGRVLTPDVDGTAMLTIDETACLVPAAP